MRIRWIIAVLFAVVIGTACADLADGMIAYWDFETSATSNAVGTDATVLTGSPTIGINGAAAQVGSSALVLNEADEESLQLPFGSTDFGPSFTIGCWFLASNTGTLQTLFETAGTGEYDITLTSIQNTSTDGLWRTTIGSVSSQYKEGWLPWDEWHHVMQVFTASNGTTTLSLYYDNALVGTTSVATSNMQNMVALNLGTQRYANSRWCEGMVDDFAMWSRALTSNEVTEAYNLGVAGQPLPTPEPLSVTDGLIAHWDFETSATNNAVGADAVVLTGSPTIGSNALATAKVGNSALVLDAADHESLQLPFGTADLGPAFTIGCWFFISDTGDVQTLYETAGSEYDITFTGGLSSTSSNSLWRTTIGSVSSQFKETRLPWGEWHHVMQVFSSYGDTVIMSLYHDNVLIGTTTTTSESLQNMTALNLGTYRYATGRWCEGMVDEFVMWNRALTAEEVGEVYDLGVAGQSLPNPSAVPASIGLIAYWDFEASATSNKVGADAVVLTGSPTIGSNTVATAMVGSSALVLDEADQESLELPFGSAELGDSFTLGCWFLMSNTGANQTLYETSGSEYDITLTSVQNTPSNGLWRATIGSVSSQNEEDWLVWDQWHHVMQVFSSSGGTTIMSLYYDGVLVGTTAATAESLQNMVSLYLGTYRGANGRWCEGMVDEFAIWDRALTAVQVADVYDRGVAGIGLFDPELIVTGFSAGQDNVSVMYYGRDLNDGIVIEYTDDLLSGWEAVFTNMTPGSVTNTYIHSTTGAAGFYRAKSL